MNKTITILALSILLFSCSLNAEEKESIFTREYKGFKLIGSTKVSERENKRFFNFFENVIDEMPKAPINYSLFKDKANEGINHIINYRPNAKDRLFFTNNGNQHYVSASKDNSFNKVTKLKWFVGDFYHELGHSIQAAENRTNKMKEWELEYEANLLQLLAYEEMGASTELNWLRKSFESLTNKWPQLENMEIFKSPDIRALDLLFDFRNYLKDRYKEKYKVEDWGKYLDKIPRNKI